MVNMRFLSLLLVLVYPLYIRGLKIEVDLKNDKTIKELLSVVSQLTQTVRDLGETVERQEQNINDLRQGLEERLRENELKVEWALTDGTLAPKNTSGIMKDLQRQEKKIDESLDVLREVHSFSYPASSCAEINGGHSHGVHPIFLNHSFSNQVFVSCDMNIGGGWTVIQKRFDGSVDFYRGWEEYAEGFGNLAGEHWLGLRHIHALTKDQPMELYIGLTDFELGLRYAKYTSFSVSSEEDKFRLHIGDYTGNAGDGLRYQNGQRFTTKDQDNDLSGGNCSHQWQGAWWYKVCHKSNLNGLYSNVTVDDARYMTWYYLHKKHRAMKASVMMIRPTNFQP